MATNHKSKHKCEVMARFTQEQFDAIEAARPKDEQLAAFVRRMTLAGVAGTHGADLRRVAAFIVGVLSTEYTPDQILPLLDEYLRQQEEQQ